MAISKFITKEIVLDALALVWLLFVLTNASPTLGTAYNLFIYASVFFLFVNIFIGKGVRVTFQKKEGGGLEAFFVGLFAWVVLLAISYFVLKIVDPTTSTIGSIISSFGAANPAFSQSKIVNGITIGLVVAYAETQLWARGAEFIADLLNIPINRKNKFAISYVILVIALSVLFAVFHITAKSVSATSALTIVAIMMAMSLYLVAYFDGETRQAFWMHAIANSAATIIVLFNGGLFNG